MITNHPISSREQALQYGTLMGIFWIVKFCFLPLGFQIPILQVLFLFGTIFSPILAYLFARKYRNDNTQDEFSFFKAFSFVLSMYMAATLLVAVAHYIYFKYIDQGYLINMYQQLLEELKHTVQPEMGASIEQLTQAFDLISTLTPLQLTFQLMSQNMFYGIFLSCITAFIVKRKKINNQSL